LQYYLRLRDTHRAANQDWLRTAQIVKIRTVHRKSTQRDSTQRKL
jgi:hypothetical protein